MWVPLRTPSARAAANVGMRDRPSGITTRRTRVKGSTASLSEAMRLLFFVEHFERSGSGAENDAVNLCLALAARGHDVHVCCDTARDYPAVTVHKPLANIDRVLADIAPDCTVDWAMSHRADVHWAGGGAHQEFLRYKALSYSGIARAYKLLENRRLKHRRLLRREAGLYANRQAFFLPNSHFCARQLVAAGADERQVTVLYNGYDFSRFRPVSDPERTTLRRKLGIPEQAIAFLFVAHNLRLKNLSLLRRVFDALSPTLPDLRLVVVGKRRPSIHRPYLQYCGVTDSIEAFYAASDGLLHPTFYDSCANVVIEAQACGIPVISSDVNGSAEAILAGETGWILPVHGLRKVVRRTWAEKVEELARDESLRCHMGKRAREHILATFRTHDDYVREFERIMAGIAG